MCIYYRISSYFGRTRCSLTLRFYKTHHLYMFVLSLLNTCITVIVSEFHRLDVFYDSVTSRQYFLQFVGAFIIYVRTYIIVHTYIHTYVPTYIHTKFHNPRCTQKCWIIWTHIRIYVCMYVCMYACMHALCSNYTAYPLHMWRLIMYSLSTVLLRAWLRHIYRTYTS
jgi:hypothetical protein